MPKRISKGTQQITVKVSDTKLGGRFSGSRNLCFISGSLSYIISSDFFTLRVGIGGRSNLTFTYRQNLKDYWKWQFLKNYEEQNLPSSNQ